MGIGMLFDEALRSENGHGYFNLPYRLSANGLIDETVFSVYLDDINSQTSSLLFGGIDTDKYDGELAVFDVPPTADGLVEYLVYITSMSIIGSEGNSTSLDVPGQSSGGTSALLDTGSTAMSLPISIVRDIYEQFQVEVSNVGPVVPCSLANSGAKFSFGLGGSSGPTITVPIAEVVRKTNLINNPNIGTIILGASGGFLPSDLTSFFSLFGSSLASLGTDLPTRLMGPDYTEKCKYIDCGEPTLDVSVRTVRMVMRTDAVEHGYGSRCCDYHVQHGRRPFLPTVHLSSLQSVGECTSRIDQSSLHQRSWTGTIYTSVD